MRLLRKDVINASKNKVNLDSTYAISRRVGLSQIPLGCVFLRYISLALFCPGPQAYITGLSYLEMAQHALAVFGCLFLCKMLVGLSLLLYSMWSYNSDEATHEVSKRKAERNVWMERMSNIERFTVWKGKIVG
jgi:hypothetical protein